jgi:hypothetical protein
MTATCCMYIDKKREPPTRMYLSKIRVQICSPQHDAMSVGRTGTTALR